MTMNTQNQERALGWDDSVENVGSEFILLTPGEYDFTVKGFERSYFDGSDKMPACPVAVVTIAVVDPVTGGEASVQNRLMLHTKTQWRIAQFFSSIGLGAAVGETFVPRWQEITGKQGRVKIKHRTYDGNTYNDVDKFIEVTEKAPTPNGYSF